MGDLVMRIILVISEAYGSWPFEQTKIASFILGVSEFNGHSGDAVQWIVKPEIEVATVKLLVVNFRFDGLLHDVATMPLNSASPWTCIKDCRWNFEFSMCHFWRKTISSSMVAISGFIATITPSSCADFLAVFWDTCLLFWGRLKLQITLMSLRHKITLLGSVSTSEMSLILKQKIYHTNSATACLSFQLKWLLLKSQ